MRSTIFLLPPFARLGFLSWPGCNNSLRKPYAVITGALQLEVSRIKAELQALSDAKGAIESDASAAVAEKSARLAEAMEKLRSFEAAEEESKEAIAALELQARCGRFKDVGL